MGKNDKNIPISLLAQEIGVQYQTLQKNISAFHDAGIYGFERLKKEKVIGKETTVLTPKQADIIRRAYNYRRWRTAANSRRVPPLKEIIIDYIKSAEDEPEGVIEFLSMVKENLEDELLVLEDELTLLIEIQLQKNEE